MNNMNIKISIANEVHLNEIVDITMDSIIGEKYFVNKNINEIIHKGIKNNEIYIADENSKVSGFLWYTKDGCFGKYPYLHMLIVGKQYRNRKYGTKLLNYFEEELFSASDKLFLMVADFNTKAKSLYERLGYIEVGRLPKFYTKEVDEILMMKDKLT